MSFSQEPLNWDWCPMNVGDTKYGFTLTDTEATTTLARVQLIVEDGDGVEVFNRDSDVVGEITINNATAGAWSFTIEDIPPAKTAALTPCVYYYKIKTTDTTGDQVHTELGEWKLE